MIPPAVVHRGSCGEHELSKAGCVAPGELPPERLEQFVEPFAEDRSGETRGGHLMSGTVRPTLEVVLVETPAHLRRTNRPQFGIALIDLTSPEDPESRAVASAAAERRA
jgi:hypothetical protein